MSNLGNCPSTKDASGEEVVLGDTVTANFIGLFGAVEANVEVEHIFKNGVIKIHHNYRSYNIPPAQFELLARAI